MAKILFIVALFLLQPSHVEAQTVFSVEPSVIEINTASASADVTIHNSGDTELTGTVSSITLEVEKDGRLTPQIPFTPVPGITLEGSNKSVQLIIPPRSHKQLHVTITNLNTSSSTTPALLFSTQAEQLPEGNTASSLAGGIVIPVLMTGDPQKHTLTLTDFSAPLFAFSSIVKFDIRLSNPSTTITKASGILIIRNLLGQEIERYEIPEHYIFPHQTRQFNSLTWDPKLAIGIYRAEFEASYARSSLYSTRVILGLPLRYAISLIVIGIIASGIYLRVRKYRT